MDYLRRHTKSKVHYTDYTLIVTKPPPVLINFINRTSIIELCPYCGAYIETCNTDHMKKHLVENEARIKRGFEPLVAKWPNFADSLQKLIIVQQMSKTYGHRIEAPLLINSRLKYEIKTIGTEYEDLRHYISSKGNIFRYMT